VSVETVRAFLAEMAPDIAIIELDDVTATVELAAQGHGVEPAQIAKTLSLRAGGREFLVVMRGDARLDNKKAKAAFGGKVSMLAPEEVEAITGHPVGGVCPFGLRTPLPVYCDVSLKAFEEVVPAAGSINSAIRINPLRMAELVGAEWVDIARKSGDRLPRSQSTKFREETPERIQAPHVYTLLNRYTRCYIDFVRAFSHWSVLGGIIREVHMAAVLKRSDSFDAVWDALREEATLLAAQERALAGFIHGTVLSQRRFEDALSYHLANRLGEKLLAPILLREIIDEAIGADREIGAAARADLEAVVERDPACHSHLQAFLFFKGFHALESYRIAHWLWRAKRSGMALFFQNRISELFGVDIHPAAKLGSGILIDHGSGVVIGETAVVENNVSMLHGVTLGGTGKEAGDRHPKVRAGALLSVGATVLGNIEIGNHARVGAGSVVLNSVPAQRTAVGVPARVLDSPTPQHPSREMDHFIADGI
jgi:serine O-acetyltransferase